MSAASAYSSSYYYCAVAASSKSLPRLSPSITRRRITTSATRKCTSLHNERYSHMPFSPLYSKNSFLRMVLAAATPKNNNTNPKVEKKNKVEEQVVEEEEELPWIQEKALDLVDFTGSVTQAIPGPRVGQTSFPWILAIPLAYVGTSFVFALVKTLRNFNSPKQIRRKLVNKNAVLCRSIDELFEKERDGVQQSALQALMQKTGFNMEEIFRKYIRYALNEKPFNPELVANLIQLRKASMLDDSQVAETLNEISRRIVKDKGPVVMDMSGYSEKGFKRKVAVQALFGKVYYLSELPEFCSRDSSLIVKEVFGVTGEDAEKLRMHTISEAGDVDSLEKMVDGLDTDDSSDVSSPPAP